MKTFAANRWFHPLLILLWVIIGAFLRLMRLSEKAPWADEFSTIIFSLGHSFRSVPLNQAIPLDILMEPLLANPATGIGDVIHYLFKESNHPPLYFLLTHLWLKLFASEDGLASLWAARSLAVLFGVAAIPAIFFLGNLAFRSRVAGQIAAAMMAVSPFAVFLAQEARHYTLATLFVIASLCCLISAVRSIHHRTPLSLWLILTWIVINTLGVATHYFFSLTLCAEAFALIAIAVRQRFWEKQTWLGSHWLRIYQAAGGTLMGGLVWIPIFISNYSSELTHWIYDGHPLSRLLGPIGRVIAWAIAILVALPMEITTLPVVIVIISGIVMVTFVFWASSIFSSGFKLLREKPDNHLSLQVLGEFIIGALLLFFAITYGLGADLTLAARYQFVYFPAAIALIGATLATHWQNVLPAIKNQPNVFQSYKNGSKKAVIVIWLMALIGAITVTWNLAYLQTLRSDLLVQVIQKFSHSPVLIATTYQHHGQTGRMMGLAWEWKRSSPSSPTTNQENTASPQFLLAYQDKNSPTPQNPTATLQETVAGLPRPLDIWLVNFHATVELQQQNCFAFSSKLPKVDSYWYRLYRCPAVK